ncbi:hypothetical protein M408DRAFT_136103 [Serendipita vermifera MAFF 305830]|uniref:Uncharacterized protein n=1 Tax=Serendipita vermifera MAFF 305830 TaxID=933852 RepID=A0A0C3AVE6_SERVB|nr:hypothetical protein M408DRAFT_136103 [Serendipita vermifera MAFF 305830]
MYQVPSRAFVEKICPVTMSKTLPLAERERVHGLNSRVYNARRKGDMGKAASDLPEH